MQSHHHANGLPVSLTAEAARLEAAQPAEQELDALAWRLGALADPRLRVALVLASAGELCVGETAALLGLPIKLVSHHVRCLAERGLATKQLEGKLIRYRLTQDGSASGLEPTEVAPRP